MWIIQIKLLWRKSTQLWKNTHGHSQNQYLLWISEPMSLPACLSIADVPLRQSDTVASLQHRSRWCNALWDVVTIHLSSSRSHVPHSRNSTFCLATAIPQMQSGWQRTITVQHQVTMTTAIYLICISCLHYRLMPNMVNFRPPHPLPCTSSLPPFLQQRALALRFMYTDINASYFFHAGCE